jgi:hypothetical protein
VRISSVCGLLPEFIRLVIIQFLYIVLYIVAFTFHAGKDVGIDSGQHICFFPMMPAFLIAPGALMTLQTFTVVVGVVQFNIFWLRRIPDILNIHMFKTSYLGRDPSVPYLIGMANIT